MDNEEFKRRISELADWHIPKLCQTEILAAQKAKRGKGRPTNEEKYQDEHEEVFLDLFQGINPTHTPEVTNVKRQACTCEDCGAHCPNGREKEAKLYKTGRDEKRNWRQKCLTCQRSKNPFTGEFDLTVSEAPHVWTTFLRETKGAYKTEMNQARSNSYPKQD